MPDNNGNGVDDQNENLDEDHNEVETNRLNVDSKKKWFIKKFIQFQYGRNDGGWVDFLNKISKAGSLTWSLKKDLERYARNNPDAEGFDMSSISYWDLTKEVTENIVVLNNKRKQLQWLIFKSYDISKSQYSSDLAHHVENLELSEISALESSPSSLDKFLKKHLGKNIVKKNLIEKMKWFNLETKYRTLSEDGKDAVAHLFDRFDTLSKISTNHLHELFATWVFSDQEKIDFVQTFIPTITLAEAVSLKLISKDKAQKYRESVTLEGLALNKNVDASKLNIEKIAKQLDDNEISIDTNALIKKSGDAMRLMSMNGESLKYVRDEFNTVIENVSETNTQGMYFAWFKQELVAAKKLDASSAAKFVVGNTIVINENITKKATREIEQEKPEKNKRYLKILDDGSSNGIIRFQKRWINKYDDSIIVTEELGYKQFLAMMTKGWKAANEYGDYDTQALFSSIEAYSDTDITNLIQSWEIVESSDKLRLWDSKPLLEKRAKDKKQYRDQLEAEKDEFGDRKYRPSQVQDMIDEKFSAENFQQETDALYESNHGALEQKINEIDDKWKDYKLNKWTTFQIWETWSSDYAMFTIVWIHENQVSLQSSVWWGAIEKVDFQSFYQTFKDKKAKRTSYFEENMGSFENVISSVASWEWKIAQWKQFKLSKNTIVKKDWAEDKNIIYPYLGGTSSEELLKIEKINGDQVTFKRWKIKARYDQAKRDKGKSRTESKVWDDISLESRTYTANLGFIDSYIKEHGLVPRWEKEDDDIKSDEDNAIDGMKGNFFSKIFQNLSIFDIWAWMKIWLESIQNYLKEWNDQHAAQFASWFFGKILPEDLKNDLKARVEQTEKKSMDDYIQRLKDVDSSDATIMIASLLLNTDSPEPHKEAGAIFMMEKYGTLYAKKWLNQYKWSFLWYKALWGSVNDTLYNQIKAQQEAKDENFNEELLVYVLLVKQCQWKLKPNRLQTRLHKNFKRVRAQWKTEEIETGRTDSADERTIAGRIGGGIEELGGWTYPNAIGWAENVINKWGTMAEMTKIPFVMAFSWIAYRFDSLQISDALKNFCAKWLIIPLTRFMSHTSDMDLLNNTIVELAARIQARTGSKHAGMSEWAQRIFANQQTSGWSDEKRLTETEDFFDTHGDVIVRSLFMLNDGKTDDEAELSKIIFFEKDEHLDENGATTAGSSTFEQYYDKMEGLMDADTDFTNKDTMTDAFKHAGTSWYYMFKAAKNIEQSQGWGFKNHDVWSFMWEEIQSEFHAIIDRKSYSQFGEDSQKKLIKDMLGQFLAALLELHSTNTNVLRALSSQESAIWSQLIKWGIDIRELAKRVTYHDLLKGHYENSSWVPDMMDGYVKKMLDKWDYSWDVSGTSISSLSEVEVEMETDDGVNNSVNRTLGDN